MSQIITRKFGLKTDDINKVQKIFLKFRDFENLIITGLLSYADDPDYIDQFKQKAKIGYKMAYDYFNINRLAPKTYLGLDFKERMKRAAMYYPYFAIRNYLIRKNNLARILDLLKVMFQNYPSECVNFIRNGTITRQHLIGIKHELSHNLYEERQSLSIEYLSNHLSQLRKIILKNMVSNLEINDVLNETSKDPSKMKHIIFETLNGFGTQRKRHEIQIKQDELPAHLRKLFITSIKRKSTRLFKIYKDRDISKARSPLLQMINSIGTENITDFKRERDFFLSTLDNSADINLYPLCKDVINEVTESITSAKCPLHKLIAPKFKSIPIDSIDDVGLIEYIKIKLRYKVMSILPDIIFQGTSGIITPVLDTLNLIKEHFSDLLNIPMIKTLTINLPFREQLWKNISEDSGDLKQSFIFTPLKKSATTFFKFSIFNTPRKEALFHDDMFISPPILKLQHRKLILIQPFEQKGIEIPDHDDNIEMGIDLGLKHFAVISIRDKQRGDEIARYFLGQKAIFGYKFNQDSSKFNPLMGVNWNIKRKLMHLRSEVRDVQTKKASYEINFPNDGKRQFHIDKTLSCLWDKINRIHLEIRNQLTHRILQIAQFHKVSLVKFEDLSWSKHSRKSISGKWITYNQIHWFHSKIIQHVAQTAKRVGIKVGIINARWSSQICSHCAKGNDIALNITMQSDKNQLHDYFGSRIGKQFRCKQMRNEDDVFHNKFELDADLNAARNICMRPLIRSLV